MTCPALHVLRGTMGTREDGTPVQPGHSRNDQGRTERTCRHCFSTHR